MQTTSQKAKVGVAVAAFALATFLVVKFMFGPGEQSGYRVDFEYFYDLGSGELYVKPAGGLPPLPGAPSGKQGVRAHVFACGENCDKADQRFIGFLEKYTEKGKGLIGTGSSDLATEILYASPEGMKNAAVNTGGDPAQSDAGTPDAWHPSNSEDGIALQRAGLKRCPAGKARACYPQQVD